MNTNSVDFFHINKLNTLPDDIQLVLAVWEIRNPENIGHIIRIAHNVGALKVVFISEKKIFQNPRIEKTAGSSFEQMDWDFITKQEFMQIVQADFKLVVLETCSGAENIFEKKLPRKSIILAGNESYGLPDEMIKLSDQKVYIPMPGGCKSMNVSHALSVASFEWYRQISV